MRRDEAGGPPPGTSRVRLRVPARASSLPGVRAVVAAELGRRRWDGEQRGDVLLALSEAVENAIEHGSAPDAPVEVELVASRDRARVRVADTGRPGARVPDQEPEPPEPQALRGRGRVIMRALADRVDVRHGEEGTVVVLDFHDATARGRGGP